MGHDPFFDSSGGGGIGGVGQRGLRGDLGLWFVFLQVHGERKFWVPTGLVCDGLDRGKARVGELWV